MATAQTFAALKTRFVQVASQATHGDTASSDATTVVDTDGDLAAWFKRVGGGQTVILRPDHQVFGVYGKNGVSTLQAELAVAAEKLAAMIEPTQ